MSKVIYCLSLLMALIVSSGCETIHDTACGAASGFSKDVHNASDPDKNGWNAIKKTDDWIQKNMW